MEDAQAAEILEARFRAFFFFPSQTGFCNKDVGGNED